MIKRILIDTNALTIQDSETGIQRVIKKIIIGLTETCANVEIIPFNNHPGKCVVSKELIDTLIPNNTFQLNQEIILTPGDHILNADMLPGVWQKYFQFYLDAKQLNIPVSWVCHDLIPCYYPQFWDAHVSVDFTEMIDIFFNHIVDHIICVSKTVADDHVVKYFNNIHRPYPAISYWHLGSDVKSSTYSPTVIPDIADKKYLLMVGTVEPRKNHNLALAAMNMLWENGSDLCLVIVGIKGWLADETIKVIESHPYRNKKLFYFGHVSDDELIYCYKNCKALLQLSTVEGFGLPLTEASYYGAEIVCSDIPVFREVAGEYANYVSLDPIKLVDELSRWDLSNVRIDSKNMPKLSWADSCNNLTNILFNGHVYLPATKETQNYDEFYNSLRHNNIYIQWLHTRRPSTPSPANTKPQKISRLRSKVEAIRK